MNKITALMFAGLVCLNCLARPTDEKRVMKYFPDGRDIVCLNGEGRYTRALYGTATLFRLETSDRPVFATYDKTDRCNILFMLNGQALDQTSWCEARYRGGIRTYTLRDESWGKGELRISVMASFFEEGAVWRFETSGFDAPVRMEALKRAIAGSRFNRNGDLGTDPRSSFEARPGDPGERFEWEAGEVSYFVLHHHRSCEVLGQEEGSALYAREAQAQKELEERIVFNTPDPFINTIGANLTAATESIWDDESQSWVHGAIGWRTPLAGWRGAYAGDVTGWSGRSRRHFEGYLKSMVTDRPVIYEHPQQDPGANLCRGAHVWGTPMYSNGYICRRPGRPTEMTHYDMNLNLIDELLWHVSYQADTTWLRQIWPYLQLHHEWEKRNWDPDGDHLYDAYCCIWASDALYYNSGAVTHSSAYNYRGNLLTARIAELIGEDPSPYRQEAEAILKALNERLWLEDGGYWAEFQDFMGLKRIHPSAALWSVYTPIDCESCTPEQAFRATRYVDRAIPHIPVSYRYDKKALKQLGIKLPKPCDDLFTLSTSDWMPYVWSTNNVAHEEVANMALAYLQAGRNEEGFKLLKADLLDEMYLGACPGNFGQISYYDKARTEAYRDFADNVGITSRALVNGLFGILPNALWGECIIKPSFPDDWDDVSIRTPYLSYSFHRNGKQDIYEIEQHFASPLQIIVRANAGGGAFLEVKGNSQQKQTIVVNHDEMPAAKVYPSIKAPKSEVGKAAYMKRMGLDDINAHTHKQMIDISQHFNANADDIFRNEYLSPRSPYTTLSLPKQGVGEWCIPSETHVIEDNGLRQCIREGVYDTGLGLCFRSPEEGLNIVYTSLFDNYPDSVCLPLEGRAKAAYLLMAGSTNNMQSRIENGRITVRYTDGTCDVMPLENPINWCPVEQDYYVDKFAFWTAPRHPYRVLFSNGVTSRDLSSVRFGIAAENGFNNFDVAKATDRLIPNGAAQILKMPLKHGKTLESLTLQTLSNDVVIGLMGVTLETGMNQKVRPL